MTSAEASTFTLNPAQARGLRNWTRREWPAKAIEVVVPTPGGPAVELLRDTVAQLVDAHEALRSCLVRGPDGSWRQRVVDRETAARDLAFDTCELPADQDLTAFVAGLGPEPVDPEHRAVRCRAFTRAGDVRVVLLSLSHFFADGVSQLLLWRTLHGVLEKRDTKVVSPSLQARDFSGERLAPAVRENTRAWRDLLADAPRCCVFAATDRAPVEEVHCAETRVPESLVHALPGAARALGVTPYTVWTTATSLLVSRYTGHHSMVFKTQLANRTRPAEFRAVAQLAQAAFIPVAGGERDSAADRAAAVFEAALRGQGIGIHDTVALLGWLDEASRRRGASFRPAFDINYGASIGGARLPQVSEGTGRREFRESQRTDPRSGAADLAVTVWQESGATTLTLRVKPPLWGQRPAGEILDDLLACVEALVSRPESTADDMPAPPLPGRDRLLRDPVSGVDIDPEAMNRLLRADPRVVSAAFTLPSGTGRDRGVSAAVVTDRPVDGTELVHTYTEAQRLMDGTVVPARLELSFADEGDPA
ncbi:condensation domain-containing protein [Streptomyces albidoflavus]